MLDKNPGLKGILLAALAAVCWGVLAIALKVTSRFMDSYSIVWLRFLIAFVLLVIWFLITDRKKLKILISPPLILVVGAFCLSLNFIGYMQGIRYSGPGNAQILIQMGPILLAIMGIFIFREKLSLFQFSGFITAVTGFIIFYIDQLDHTLVSKSDYRLSVLYLVLASVGWATYAVLQKKLVRTWPAQQLNLVIYGLPVLLFLPLSDFQTYMGHDFSTWLLLIFLGLNTLIAYGALSSSFKYMEANKISIIITLNPVLTFVLMAVLTWLNVKWLEPEPVSFWGFAGGALVLAGAIMVVSKRKAQ